MISFIEQARIYAAYHQKPVTRYTHFVGVPLIILSLMILVGFIQIIIPGLLYTNMAELGTLAAIAFYFRLEWRLALVLTPILLFLLWIAHFFNYAGPTRFGLWAFIITFLVGWILQFIGHYLEGKRPAFVDNIEEALISPLFLIADVFFMAGLMQGLKEKIYGKDTEADESTL